MIPLAVFCGFVLGAPVWIFLMAIMIAADREDDAHDNFGAGYAQGYRVGAFEALSKAEREAYRENMQPWRRGADA